MTSAPLPDRRRRQEAAGAVGGLFERHGRMVYGLCRAMLRDLHEAEDATQQVFLSAHHALIRGANVREPGSWLATIARNECRARITAGMRRPLSIAEEDLDAVAASGDEHDRRMQLVELRAALAGLPERQREAAVLRYVYGLRYAEVATALGLSRPATEALLFRARRSLRIRLRPVVGAALLVPAVVREELALALPGFGGVGSGAAAAGVSGGLLAKLTAGPVGLKAATAVVAVSTVGAVGTATSERVEGRDSPKAEHAAGAAGVVATPRGDDDAGSRPASGASSRSAGVGGHRGGVSSGDRETEQESSGDGSDGGHGGESPEPAMSSSGHGGESSGHDARTSSGLGPGTSVEAAAPTATVSSGPGGGDSGTSGHGGGAEPTAVPSADSSGSGSGGDSLAGGSSGSGSGSSGHSGADAPDD